MTVKLIRKFHHNDKLFFFIWGEKNSPLYFYSLQSHSHQYKLIPSNHNLFIYTFSFPVLLFLIAADVVLFSTLTSTQSNSLIVLCDQVVVGVGRRVGSPLPGGLRGQSPRTNFFGIDFLQISFGHSRDKFRLCLWSMWLSNLESIGHHSISVNGSLLMMAKLIWELRLMILWDCGYGRSFLIRRPRLWSYSSY